MLADFLRLKSDEFVPRCGECLGEFQFDSLSDRPDFSLCRGQSVKRDTIYFGPWNTVSRMFPDNHRLAEIEKLQSRRGVTGRAQDQLLDLMLYSGRLDEGIVILASCFELLPTLQLEM